MPLLARGQVLEPHAFAAQMLERDPGALVTFTFELASYRLFMDRLLAADASPRDIADAIERDQRADAQALHRLCDRRPSRLPDDDTRIIHLTRQLYDRLALIQSNTAHLLGALRPDDTVDIDAEPEPEPRSSVKPRQSSFRPPRVSTNLERNHQGSNGRLLAVQQ